MTGRTIGLLALAGLASASVPACSSTADEDRPPQRACGLTVWHRASTAEAHVEIVGDWNEWQRPGAVPERAADGWRVARIDAPPGEHAYAIVEDGVWLIDKQTPMTSEHEKREVSLAIVPDCGIPQVKVESVETTPAGDAKVHARFLAARSGASLAASSIDAGGLRVAAVDPKTGVIELEANGLPRGKSVHRIAAKDADGVAAEDARATVWLDGRGKDPWDPRDAIVYQVFIDRFRAANGAPLATPKTPAARAGGTLAGVRAALDSGELESLGVDTLWLSPLYANPDGEYPGNDGRAYTSYHGYWPVASRALDPRVTTEEELDAFMGAAHAKGVRVLFDVVPNHVHEKHPFASEHRDWFVEGCVCGQGACDWANNIQTCWFASYLPDFDWKRADVARAVTEDVLWWFDRWGADGVRIDAVPMMPRSATRRIATAIRSRYEHAGNASYVLGENFTGPGGFGSLRYDLGPFGLDGSFHFPLMWTLRETLAEERAPMSKIDTDFRAGEKEWNGSGAVMALMIGNHDVSRFASVSAGNADGDTWSPPPQPVDPLVYAKQRVALAAVLTLPGAPVIYYGDEVGLAGRSDPDCRRVMPAEADLLPAQQETRDVARRIGKARSCSKALRRGGLTTLLADDESFVFARTGEDGETAIVVLTRRPKLAAKVPLAPGAPVALVDVVTGARADATNGSLDVASDAFGIHVYVAVDSACASSSK